LVIVCQPSVGLSRKFVVRTNGISEKNGCHARENCLFAATAIGFSSVLDKEMGFFDREQTVARPGFSRWLVPPAALAVHLSIGQVYAFSVFKLPLTKVIGITKSAPDDRTQPELAWIFSLAIFFLGVSAAAFGRWVERAGWRSWASAAGPSLVPVSLRPELKFRSGRYLLVRPIG